MKTLITLLIATMFFLPVGASATVTGEGTFDLVGFPDSATIGNYGYSTSYTDPVTGEYINVQNYFSYIRENDSNDLILPINNGHRVKLQVWPQTLLG
jgi:hypothetical protein